MISKPVSNIVLLMVLSQYKTVKSRHCVGLMPTLTKCQNRIRTCKLIQRGQRKSERDRGGQRRGNWVDSHPGYRTGNTYCLHFCTAVQILVSGSQVVPLTQWSLKPAHVLLSLRSECMNNQLVNWYLTLSQLNCVHQKETQHITAANTTSQTTKYFEVWILFSCTCWTNQVRLIIV